MDLRVTQTHLESPTQAHHWRSRECRRKKYRILHELSFNINFYKTRLRDCYIEPLASFITLPKRVYTKMTMSVRFILSCDFSVCMDLIDTGHVFRMARPMLLDWCNIKIFLMVILHLKQGKLCDKKCTCICIRLI